MVDVPLVEDLIFDVGMHPGQDTDDYLAKGYRAIAFEANPGLARECHLRFEHAARDGRLTIIEGGDLALRQVRNDLLPASRLLSGRWQR